MMSREMINTFSEISNTKDSKQDSQPVLWMALLLVGECLLDLFGTGCIRDFLVHLSPYYIVI